MSATVDKNCEACGDLIAVRIADHKRGWGRFCDKTCAAAWKSGQRPRDVNAVHAKMSSWAADRFALFTAKYGDGNKPPKAARVKDQIGKVKVVPTYHSPSWCRECGAPINGPGLCDPCDWHIESMRVAGAGWDGHKGWP
jgi:hypothetical protein